MSKHTFTDRTTDPGSPGAGKTSYYFKGQKLFSEGPSGVEEYATLPVGGGGGWTVATETTAARAAVDGEFVLVNVATCVVTLPAPVTGARVAVKVISATVTDIQIKTSGAGIDIDGTDHSATGLVLSAQFEQIAVVSDGTDWWIY